MGNKISRTLRHLHISRGVGRHDNDELSHKDKQYFEKQYYYPLPDELWEAILLKLDSSADIDNFCVAFPKVEIVMHRTKHIWVFDQIFPLILKSINKEDVLNLRLVCKRWCSGVNKTLEERPLPLHPWLLSTGLFYINLNTSSLIKSHEDCANRRKVLVGNYNKLRQILHLRLRINCHTTDIYIDFMCRFLIKCPNLKSLQLLGMYGIGNSEQIIHFPDGIDPMDERKKLETVWPSNLEFLSFDDIDNQDESLLKEICVPLMFEKPIWLNIIKPSKIIQMSSICKLSFIVRSASQLSSLLDLNLLVTEISLYVSIFQTDCQGEMVCVLLFKVLEKFKSTLSYVLIDVAPNALKFRRSTIDLKILSLDLPKLTTLYLINFPLPAMDSLSDLKSLHYLYIKGGTFASSKLNLVLSPNGFEIAQLLILKQNYPFHAPYFSNVWNIFPRLREFHFTNIIDNANNTGVSRCYRRDMADRHAYFCKFEICRHLQSNKLKMVICEIIKQQHKSGNVL